MVRLTLGRKLFNINTFKKTHQELGFIEPFKYYEPSIGISEIIFRKSSFCKSKCFFSFLFKNKFLKLILMMILKDYFQKKESI